MEIVDLEKLMKIAIKQAKTGAEQGEPPFGGIIINNGRIIARGHDTVVKNHDMTRHSEINLVHKACKKLGNDLSGCIVICTCEPCPLCFTALWLAKVKTVVFGSTISDVLALSGTYQREINIPADEINNKSGNKISLIKGILNNECIKLWQDRMDKFNS